MKLAEGLNLPADAATQVLAFMGRRGSGKTYGAGKLVELLIDAGQQVVIIDPVGVWAGLRWLADGKPGYEIPIVGGQHGDIPLQATAGHVVADLVAKHAMSMVLDVSDFTGADQRRFVADFATELLHAKKRARSPLMVVLEEAQEFVPQYVRADLARMVGALEKLVKLGRNFGVGTTLISQRPQAVNKDVLNQAEVLFAFQLTGPQERKAIEGWVQEKGAAGRGELAGELPSLPVGTAFVWSPQWLNVYGRYRILKKRTADLSATPTRAAEGSKPLPPIELGALKEAMAATLEEAKASDPKELRAELGKARRELADLRAAANHKPKETAIPFVPPKVRQGLDHIRAELFALAKRLDGVIEVASKHARMAADETPPPQTTTDVARQEWLDSRRQAKDVARRPPAIAGAAIVPGLNRGHRKILEALAARYPTPLSRSQIARLAVMAPTGGTLRTYLGALATRGLIERDGKDFTITTEGIATVGPTVPATTPRELVAMWREKLTGKERDMLELFAAEHGPFRRDELADRIGIDAKGGTFRTYLGKLCTLGLVRKTSRGLEVNPELSL